MPSTPATSSNATSDTARCATWRFWPGSVLRRFIGGRLRRWRAASGASGTPTPAMRLGRGGEAEAARYLTRQGYRLLAQDVRVRHGQIDLVARDGDVLCFIEVKTRRGDARGAAVEAVTPAKQRQMVRAAMYFVAQQRLPRTAMRFDVVAVTTTDDGRCSCRLVRNAFDAGSCFTY